MADHQTPRSRCTTGRMLRVTGRVQGVFFRASAQAEAEDLSLTGWVRNTEDGAVEIVVGGQGPAVDALIRWCHHGPKNARVDQVEERAATADELAALPDSGFEIRR
ncbi:MULTISPECIES: acylphosphatase [unclassified Nesterenkonia]|uniref:acylphosphatase n=1 Tax=unclassified Nesterenkonia TaxID=2629769 RepID=UPI0009F3581B|nr:MULTISPECIES: acylphosphatase [unclassified Nesterenkonia]MDS2171222.1 acylphosphatase [Nesterenkonia sp. CL21]OSM44274.1 hypothetical protein BCY76_003525 [Nesterenkonia sp. PF2B19]